MIRLRQYAADHGWPRPVRVVLAAPGTYRLARDLWEWPRWAAGLEALAIHGPSSTARHRWLEGARRRGIVDAGRRGMSRRVCPYCTGRGCEECDHRGERVTTYLDTGDGATFRVVGSAPLSAEAREALAGVAREAFAKLRP